MRCILIKHINSVVAEWLLFLVEETEEKNSNTITTTKSLESVDDDERERETNTQRGDNNLKIEAGGGGGVPHVLLYIACVFVQGVAHKYTYVFVWK